MRLISFVRHLAAYLVFYIVFNNSYSISQWAESIIALIVPILTAMGPISPKQWLWPYRRFNF